jgi:hypothetical protein
MVGTSRILLISTGVIKTFFNTEDPFEKIFLDSMCKCAARKPLLKIIFIFQLRDDEFFSFNSYIMLAATPARLFCFCIILSSNILLLL